MAQVNQAESKVTASKQSQRAGSWNPQWLSQLANLAIVGHLSVYFPAGSLGLLVAQGQGPLAGLLQRLLVATISGWIILVALRVRKIAGAAEERRPWNHPRKETQ